VFEGGTLSKFFFLSLVGKRRPRATNFEPVASGQEAWQMGLGCMLRNRSIAFEPEPLA
jgi:hypothetical protein